ncbi:MAG: carbohydrate binding family 9 domain-containing protein [Balneolaceae bacterium]|nr:carbohydrate binding family 9 domain-containing protein [Balneolaceae bacterium]
MRTFFLLLFVLMIRPLKAQEQPFITDFNLGISKITDQIKIDGKMDETAWLNATSTSEFLNKWPRDEGYAINQTKAWVMYDDEHLYVAAINYQKKEDLVVATLKRDNAGYFWNSDGFSVVLDPYNQKTNGFLFGVNAAGAMMDGMVSLENSNTRPDMNWDNIWHSAVTVHDDYWIAEIAIPFKSINFDPTKEEWGINFVRNDMQRNEYSTWSHVPQGFPGIDLGHLGTMQLNDPLPDKNQRIILQPSILTSGSRDYTNESSFTGDVEVGLGAKIPVGSKFNMDLTVNPDFSTVDVDQQVTNLSRFSIQFPEKRAFFLENSDLFSSFGTWGVRPFFSRRIGLNGGEIVPILFGSRLTGNVNDNLRVGAMSVQTRSVSGLTANNFTVLAAQQNVWGRSSFKTLITNKNAYADGSFQNDFNRTIGAEYHFISQDNRIRGNLRYHWSQTEDRLNDASFVGATMMYDNGSFYTGITADRLGDNYINELGFSARSFQYDATRDSLIRVGFTFMNPWIGYVHRPESEWVNSHELSVWTVASFENNDRFIDRVTSLNYVLQTKDFGTFEVALRNSKVRLLYETNLIGGDEFLPAETYDFNHFNLEYDSDERGMLSGGADFSYGGFYNGTRLFAGARLNVRAQPWGNFGVRYVMNKVDLPQNYGSTTLHLLGPQAEISFSRDLSWTTFLQYNTQAENFNVNSRLQWRFAPMSDLFVVFNDNYQTEDFGIKNRGMVVKMSYWIN